MDGWIIRDKRAGRGRRAPVSVSPGWPLGGKSWFEGNEAVLWCGGDNIDPNNHSEYVH